MVKYKAGAYSVICYLYVAYTLPSFSSIKLLILCHVFCPENTLSEGERTSKMAEAGTGPASVSLFACRREERGDQFPEALLVPNGLRYCCRNTITHPGPDSRPLTVVALPHRFWPFLV